MFLGVLGNGVDLLAHSAEDMVELGDGGEGVSFVSFLGVLRDIPGFLCGIFSGEVDSLFMEGDVLDSELHSPFQWISMDKIKNTVPFFN